MLPYDNTMLDRLLMFCEQYLQLTSTEVILIPWGVLFFLVFYKLMGRLVFTPFLELLAARDAKTSEALLKAKDLHEQARSLESSVDEQINTVRSAAIKAKQAVVLEARREAAAIVAEAKAQASAELLRQREKLTVQTAAVRQKLLANVPDLVERLSEQLRQPPQM